MPRTSRFYHELIGDQIVWLRNFTTKIPNYRVALGYATGDITAAQADCARLIYLKETVQNAAQSFAQAITSHLKLMEDGPGNALVGLPDFALPSTPAPPDNVLPGALKRILTFIANLKTRTGYIDSVGQDLGIVGPSVTDDPNAVPTVKATAKSGEVLINFSKDGRTGVLIQGQVGIETDWSFVGIDTSDPYHDTRPLKVPGQPEKRRYRVCFWDGDPTNVWSPVIEVVFGG